MSSRIGSADQSLAERYKGRKVVGEHQNLGAKLFQNARIGGVDLVDGQAHQCRDLWCRDSLDPRLLERLPLAAFKARPDVLMGHIENAGVKVVGPLGIRSWLCNSVDCLGAGR